MSSVVWSVIWFGLVWTLLGSALFVVTRCGTRLMGSAALRHWAWVVAFCGVGLFPLYEGVNAAWNAKTVADLCAAAGSGTSLSPTVLMVVGFGLVGAWCAGAVWTLGRALVAWRKVNQWRIGSVDFRAHFDVEVLGNVEVRRAVGNVPAVPITWGVRKPVILLPRCADGWEATRLEAVLLHEAGHVRRLDNLTQLFALAMCALHWFNPLFWRAAKWMEAEAEIAADDFAILRGVKPSVYAKELLDLSRLTTSAEQWGFAQTAMVKLCPLEHRLVCVIDPMARRGVIGLLSFARIAGVLLGVTLGMTVLAKQVSCPFSPKTGETATCLPPEP